MHLHPTLTPDFGSEGAPPRILLPLCFRLRNGTDYWLEDLRIWLFSTNLSSGGVDGRLALHALVGLIAGVLCSLIALIGAPFASHAHMPFAGTIEFRRG